MAVAASASATRDDDGVHLSRPPPKGPTDAATTRVLALKRQKKSRKVRRMQQQQQRLLDCMFIAGLYHDKVTGEHRAYTREKFPVQVIITTHAMPAIYAKALRTYLRVPTAHYELPRYTLNP